MNQNAETTFYCMLQIVPYQIHQILFNNFSHDIGFRFCFETLTQNERKFLGWHFFNHKINAQKWKIPDKNTQCGTHHFENVIEKNNICLTVCWSQAMIMKWLVIQITSVDQYGESLPTSIHCFCKNCNRLVFENRCISYCIFSSNNAWSIDKKTVVLKFIWKKKI